ncbi:YehS family protein [Desulforhopalus sp. 52FAK]
MRNNDILRRIRYIFDLSDSKMIAIFGLADVEATRAEVSSWLKKDDDPDFLACSDLMLAQFLNGFINEKRGKREGIQVVPEKFLSNNLIMRKLKIALNLRDDDIIQLLSLARLRLGKAELSAFFRKKGHKNYRACKDQVLRNFLAGLQIQYRGQAAEAPHSVWK